MIGLQIKNIKDFMNHLFIKSSFDWLDLVEAVIVKEYTLTIEGKRNEPRGRYLEAEPQERDRDASEYLSYQEMRPLLLTHIRGKETPQMIRMTLSLPSEKLAERIEGDLTAATSQIERFLVNIRFGSQGLSLVTGVSYRSFSMEKERERLWDRYLKEFLLKEEIAFEE